jgi:hypothetical protein
MNKLLHLSLSVMTLPLGLVAQNQLEPAEVGPKIVAETFGQLSAALGDAVAQSGAPGALRICAEKAPQIATEVGLAHGVTIRRASQRPRNPRNVADHTEQEVLAAFADALTRRETPKAQTRLNEDGSRSFFAPIVLANPLCLQCHGVVVQEVKPATVEALRKLYPDDRATGFKLGDLRGLWHVRFPAKP